MQINPYSSNKACYEIFNNYHISEMLDGIVEFCFSNRETKIYLDKLSFINKNCHLVANRIKISLLNRDELKITNIGKTTDIINYIFLNHNHPNEKLSFLRIDSFRDEDIRKIRDFCPNLFLIYERISNTDFATMSKLEISSRLTELDLRRCRNMNFNNLKVANLTNLTQINLDDPCITPIHLRELIKLEKLIDYSFHTSLSYSNCKKFTQLTNLTKLKFSSDPEFLDKLVKFTKLTHLTLRPNDRQRTDFSKIYEFTNLTHLVLNNFNCLNIELMTKLIKLSCLHLDVSVITDRGFESIGKLTNLTYLHFGKKEITERALESISGLTNLTDLDIGYVNDLAIEKITQSIPLKILSINCFFMTSKSFKQLTKISSLTDLTMDLSLNATDEDLKLLKGLTNLTSINFKFPDITYAGLRELALFPNIRTIKFTDYTSNPIDDEAIKEITRDHPNFLIIKKIKLLN